MNHTYAVVAETRGGGLRQVTYETIAAARTAMEAGDRLVAILIGHPVAALAGKLAAYGVDRVIVCDHPDLEHYNPETYFPILAGMLDAIRPQAVFFGHTAGGRDLAPMVAAKLHAAQISDVVSLEKAGGGLLFKRPIYAGKASETLQVAQSQGPYVVTIRPNNIPAAEPTTDGAGTAIEPFAYSPAADLRAVVRDVVRRASGKIDLTEAKIVVAGGRGVKSAEGFKPLQELADVLGAAVGASRGACDTGYCDYSLQIGQTGKVVTPEIYIACGISGAIQHLAGMSRSRIIVAINKDPDAPIFQVADYGIVGDLFEVVPLLTEEFKKAR
jgi:electron transfer flavoprotein alpha subunit